MIRRPTTLPNPGSQGGRSALSQKSPGEEWPSGCGFTRNSLRWKGNGHQALPTVTERIGGAALAVGLEGVDLDRTAALIEMMRQRWVSFAEFAER